MTGVQTCALPIWNPRLPLPQEHRHHQLEQAKAELAPELLMQADYTRKTQEVADAAAKTTAWPAALGMALDESSATTAGCALSSAPSPPSWDCSARSLLGLRFCGLVNMFGKNIRPGELQKHEPRLWNSIDAPFGYRGILTLTKTRGGRCAADSIDDGVRIQFHEPQSIVW